MDPFTVVPSTVNGLCHGARQTKDFNRGGGSLFAFGMTSPLTFGKMPSTPTIEIFDFALRSFRRLAAAAPSSPDARPHNTRRARPGTRPSTPGSTGTYLGTSAKRATLCPTVSEAVDGSIHCCPLNSEWTLPRRQANQRFQSRGRFTFGQARALPDSTLQSSQVAVARPFALDRRKTPSTSTIEIFDFAVCEARNPVPDSE